MATASFQFTGTTRAVDALPTVLIINVTGPDGVPYIPVTVATTNRSANFPNINLSGTYSYSIKQVDSQGKQVGTLGVAYPILTGEFVKP